MCVLMMHIKSVLFVLSGRHTLTASSTALMSSATSVSRYSAPCSEYLLLLLLSTELRLSDTVSSVTLQGHFTQINKKYIVNTATSECHQFVKCSNGFHSVEKRQSEQMFFTS